MSFWVSLIYMLLGFKTEWIWGIGIVGLREILVALFKVCVEVTQGCGEGICVFGWFCSAVDCLLFVLTYSVGSGSYRLVLCLRFRFGRFVKASGVGGNERVDF